MSQPEPRQVAKAIIDTLSGLADGTTPLHYGIRRIGALVGRLTAQLEELQARIDALETLERGQEAPRLEIDRRASFV